MALKLQCVARTRIAMKALQQMRENKAAISIQTSWRRHSARKQYVAQKKAAVKIQTGELECEIEWTMVGPIINSFVYSQSCVDTMLVSSLKIYDKKVQLSRFSVWHEDGELLYKCVTQYDDSAHAHSIS
jgi:hypothetical protein